MRLSKSNCHLIWSATLALLACCSPAISQDAATDAAPEGPLVAQPLPGTSYAQLISNSYYISPFASFFGATSSRGQSSNSQQNDLARYFQSGQRRGMSRVPEMFGDYRASGVRILIDSVTIADGSVAADAPVAAGTAGLRISENNHSMPNDRIWFAYNHFHNAWDTNVVDRAGPSQTARSQDVNRFMLGAEFLLDDGATSVEIRMPFGSAINVNEPLSTVAFNGDYRLNGNSIGNLSVILKRLLLGDANRGWSTGLGIETPTGSDADGQVGTIEYRLETQAVQLTPFLAYTWRGDGWFGHLFQQLDISVSGDELFVGDAGVLRSLGQIDRGTALGTDIGIGRWIVEPRCACSNGLAAIAEIHHTTFLDDPESAFEDVAGLGAIGANVTNDTVTDLVDLTTGLVWMRPNGYSIRTAIAVPIRDERIYDTEVIFQVNRRL